MTASPDPHVGLPSADDLGQTEGIASPLNACCYRDECRALLNRALSAEAKLAQAVEALEPFVSSFEAAREAHGRRYGKDEAIGLANFDKMPDRWPMAHLKFDMGTFRRARSASAAARGETR